MFIILSILLAGKGMNRVLQELKEIWIESNFTITEEDLLKEVPEIVERVGRTSPKTPVSQKSKKKGI